MLEELSDNGYDDIRRLIAFLQWLRELVLLGERSAISLSDVEEFPCSVVV